MELDRLNISSIQAYAAKERFRIWCITKELILVIVQQGIQPHIDHLHSCLTFVPDMGNELPLRDSGDATSSESSGN